MRLAYLGPLLVTTLLMLFVMAVIGVELGASLATTIPARSYIVSLPGSRICLSGVLIWSERQPTAPFHSRMNGAIMNDALFMDERNLSIV